MRRLCWRLWWQISRQEKEWRDSRWIDRGCYERDEDWNEQKEKGPQWNWRRRIIIRLDGCLRVVAGWYLKLIFNYLLLAL